MMQDSKDGVSSTEAEIKAVCVPNGEYDEVNGTVFYNINVTGGDDSLWTVRKRYSQLEELHNSVVAGFSRHLPAGVDIPPKKIKLFTSHTSPGFIEERRCLIEAYLQKLCELPAIRDSSSYINFLSTNKTETKVESKSAVELPDDVEVTGVSIPSTRTMSDHVLYQIDVVNIRLRKSFSKWTVLKRFGQFFEMDQLVRADFAQRPDVLAAMPEAPARKAKIFNDHMDDTFVEQRRLLLENYLNKMMEVIEVVRNENFLAFLGVNL